MCMSLPDWGKLEREKKGVKSEVVQGHLHKEHLRALCSL